MQFPEDQLALADRLLADRNDGVLIWHERYVIDDIIPFPEMLNGMLNLKNYRAIFHLAT